MPPSLIWLLDAGSKVHGPHQETTVQRKDLKIAMAGGARSELDSPGHSDLKLPTSFDRKVKPRGPVIRGEP